MSAAAVSRGLSGYWEFALAPDVKISYLKRGAQRAFVGLFGERWCVLEFVGLEIKIRDGIVKGIGKRNTLGNTVVCCQ
jgi:hypothetical protein